MKVLIIGGGGREHAIAWQCAKSPRVTDVLVAPGNAGSAGERGVRNVDVAADDIDALLALAKAESIDLTIVGPEVPLVAGITDLFAAAGLRCFGPSAKAAQLEGSKAFSKAFFERHNIPSAAYGEFTDLAAATDYIHQHGAPIVVKADGLAAGKGVVVAQTIDEAIEAAREMLDEGLYGAASQRIVIEEFLRGEEASFIAITDGKTILPMATSQDHKARDDGDKGPNTGGMGAYSPAPVVTDEVSEHVMRDVMQATLDGLAADNIDYCGFLYAGLMIENGRAKVLEFNCRFGDPETQPIMMRLKSDLTVLCDAALDGRLHECTPEWDERAALGVVLAAGGYPASYKQGLTISGLDGESADQDNIKVFHAGTRLDGDNIVTAGGRVLCVTALGDDVADAAAAAYAAVERIHWDGVFCRHDIGYRAIAREKGNDPAA